MSIQEQKMYFMTAIIFIGMLLLMIVIQIISIVYDINKQTQNKEDQIIKRIKNIIILILLAIVTILLPLWGEENISIWEALIKSLK